MEVQAKVQSRDPVWYFFSRRENKYASGNRQSRRTISGSGFWKLTGESVDVKDQWGFWCGAPGKIGQKRVLGFHRGRNASSKGSKSDWVIHEYHYTLPPEEEIDQPHQGNPGSYNIFPEYGSANQEQPFHGGFNMNPAVQENSASFNPFSDYDYGLLNQEGQWFNSNCNAQQQAPYSAPYDDDQDIWKSLVEQNFDSLLDERTYMQENLSIHQPKNPVTGVFADDSSDSDTDSMICKDAWSSTDSVGSSSGPYHSPVDDVPLLTTVEPLHNYEAQLQGDVKVMNKRKSECECKMAVDSTKKTSPTNTVKQNWIVLEEISQRSSQRIYLRNMIIGFLLLISIIGWIVAVG
ncbi:unnamed protein product [Thlaspi arvense]|uniref:NAC domain-containing protein n=1 Tax=Thlaspi arvense TaxID=13288 RepID=A0AAU9REX5_THLAR|nr:unnamed protein product [Thlaspi arvense]